MTVLKKMKDLPPLPHELGYHIDSSNIHRRSLPPLPPLVTPEPTPPPVPSKTAASVISLPNEILEFIFVLAIRDSFPFEGPNHPFSKPLPVTCPQNPICHAPHLLTSVLAQTCHRFRDMVVHTPSLWSYINITRTVTPRSPRSSTSSRSEVHATTPTVTAATISGSRGRSTLDKDLGWLPLYLVRAGPALLHIVLDTVKYPLPPHTISHAEHTYPPSSSSVTSLPSPSHSPRNSLDGHPLNYLIGTSTRWASLTILTSHLGSSSLAPVLSSLSNLSVPNLTSLRVKADIWREGIVSYETLPGFFFGGAPKLRDVQLDGAYLSWGDPPFVYPSSTVAPMHNIRNLTLNFATRYPLFAPLRTLLEDGCPRLETLVIRDDLAGVLRHIEPPRMAYFETLEQGRSHGRPGRRHQHQAGGSSAGGLMPPAPGSFHVQTSSSSSGSSTDYYPPHYQAYHQPPPTLPPPSPLYPRAPPPAPLQPHQHLPQHSLPSPPMTATFPPESPTILMHAQPQGLLNPRYSVASLSGSSDGGSSAGSSAPGSPMPHGASSSGAGNSEDTTGGGGGADSGDEHGRDAAIKAFRKIRLKNLKYLEVRPYRSNAIISHGGAAVPSESNSSPSASPSFNTASSGTGINNDSSVSPTPEFGHHPTESLVSLTGSSSRLGSTSSLLVSSSSLPARLLYLFETPRLETLVIGNVKTEEWRVVAEMLGLPSDPGDFVPRTTQAATAYGGGEIESSSGSGGGEIERRGEGERTFPYMKTLDIELLDRRS